VVKRTSLKLMVSAACAAVVVLTPYSLHADSYTQFNLVSDIPGLAAHTDSNLINPWGVSFTATSPFWVSNQGRGTATLYDGAGNANTLVVTIPGGTGPVSGPTGQVANPGPGFLVNGNPARFIFDNLNGTISGWNGGTSAVMTVPSTGAIYTGLAFNSVGSASFLYAADATGGVRVFDSTWTNVDNTIFAGKFVDPNLPAGFTPYNIQSVGSNIYVTYAQLNSQGDPMPGGYVDLYDASGNLVRRVAGGGVLFGPWGVTIAPANFGAFSNDLLIGNFGSGEITVYDPLTGLFLGTINGENGQPLVNSGLWALATRTGGTNDDVNAVYFTAGIGDEDHGLFGKITAPTVPEPATIFQMGSGVTVLVAGIYRRRKAFVRSR
jgi:uncharacterized protein (TIGR03118 family)